MSRLSFSILGFILREGAGVPGTAGGSGDDAYRWLAEAGEDVCAEAEATPEGEPAGPVRTVPCDDVDAGEDPGIIECAGLAYVRESEVREYLDGLQRRHGRVECEDGTPLADLGTQ
jgi:hypothetical protein